MRVLMTRSGPMPSASRPGAAAAQPVELPRRVRVGVDGEQAAGLGGQAQQRAGRVLALGAAVDLDRDAVLAAGGEHRLGVEVRLRPAAAGDHPPGAVPQHVHVRVADRGHHPLGHRPGGHPQLGVHAGDDHVQPGEQVLALVERAVLEDVDLDPGQHAERGQLGVQLGDQLELRLQALGGQPAGHGQPGRVIGQREPLVAETARGLGHLPGRAAAVGPVGMGVAVAAQGRPQRRPLRRRAPRCSSRVRYAGSWPAAACSMTSAVAGPIPGSCAQRPAASRALSSAAGRSSTTCAARRNARTR